MFSVDSFIRFSAQLPAIFWTTDRDLRFTLSLGGSLPVLGLSPMEINGKTLYEYFGTKEKNFLPIAAHLQALKGIPAVYEFPWQGRTFYFRVKELRDADSNIIGTIGAALDITERKLAEDSLRLDAERAFRFQDTLLALAKMEPQNLELAFKKILELDAKALGVQRVSIWLFNAGRTAIECGALYHLDTGEFEKGLSLRAEDYPEYFRALEQSRTLAADDAWSDPRTREFREGYLKPNGITSMMDVPIRSQGQFFGIVCHEHIGAQRNWQNTEQEFAASVADMAALSLESFERKRAESALQRTSEALKRSNKELESFAYVASHDLQEPLHKIIGFSERLEKIHGPQLDAGARDYLSTIVRVAHGMRQLMEDLLQFSTFSLRTRPFEEVDLNALLEEVRSDLELRLEETGGTLEMGPLPRLWADRLQMKQLFQNLIGNGLKFCPRNRKPKIKIDSQTLENNRVVLSVKDNGIGIEKELIPEIFKPFVRLHAGGEFKGSGIGLALCQKIVQRHGGEIAAESTPGKGSVFKMTLPINQKG